MGATSQLGMTPLALQENMGTPMLATSGGDINTCPGGWIYDEKVDGIRATIAVQDGAVQIYTRSGRDVTTDWPELEAIGARYPGPLLLDGEIAVRNDEYRDAFERINWRSKQGGSPLAIKQEPARFVAFDALIVDGQDIRHMPLQRRRALLANLPIWNSVFQMVVSITKGTTPDGYFRAITALGAEGIVAKDPMSRYLNSRSPNWLKYKATQTVSCLVYGYEPGKGSRAHMGAALIAFYDNGSLQPVGRVGSGFSVSTAQQLADRITLAATTVSAEGFKVLPIIEVEYLGRTKEGKLRQPVFKGFRTDLSFTAITADQFDTPGGTA